MFYQHDDMRLLQAVSITRFQRAQVAITNGA